MAATHATGSLQSSISCGIGATITSTTLDNSTAYGALVTAKVTNGATGPTVACTATVNISPDGTTWYYYASQTGSLLALAVVAMAFEVPMHAVKAQVVFNGNTGQAVTVEAQYEQTTAI